MLDSIKTALRISKSNVAFDDEEILPLIDAARHDLMVSGISPEKVKATESIDVFAYDMEVDPLIRRAITLYVKCNFGWDNPDADRLQIAYDSLKNLLSLAGDYNAVP